MFSTKSKGVHSHIKGLGLDEQGLPTTTSYALIGQENAREAAGLIVDLVKQKNIAGQGVLIVGPSGSGKSALAVAMSEELGIRTPFNILNAIEVFSKEIKKTEVLQVALRKAIGVRIKEIKNIYEGEVVGLDIQMADEHYKDNSTANEISLTLRATKGTKTFSVGIDLYEQIVQQNIKKGDIVYVETSAGIIKKLGRGESHMNDFDLESEKYVPLHKGDIFRKKEVVQDTTLHSLDLSFVSPTGQDVVSLVSQICVTKKTEITDRLREEVDQMIKNYVEVGKAEVVSGVLLIEDAHKLDSECFAYLKKVMDLKDSFLLLLTSNCLETSDEGAFGFPNEFVRKMMIIPMKANTTEEMIEIIKMRVGENNIELNESAVNYLRELSTTTSLGYCLLIVSSIMHSDLEITKESIEQYASLFRSFE